MPLHPLGFLVPTQHLQPLSPPRIPPHFADTTPPTNTTPTTFPNPPCLPTHPPNTPPRDTAHRAQLTRLADLLAQKASLESQMASKLARLRASYDARSKELIAVVDTRIKELK